MDTVDKNDYKNVSSRTKRRVGSGHRPARDDDVEENSLNPPTRGSSQTTNRAVESASVTRQTPSPNENVARALGSSNPDAASVDPKHRCKAKDENRSFASSNASWMGWNEAQARQLQTDGEKQAEAAGTLIDAARYPKNDDAEFATVELLGERKQVSVQHLHAKRRGQQENSTTEPKEEHKREPVHAETNANRAGKSTSSGMPSSEAPGVSATIPGAFPSQGQRVENSFSFMPDEEAAAMSVNSAPDTVITAAVELEDDLEARVRRDVEARVRDVEARVRQDMEARLQHAVPAENVVALDVVPANEEAKEEILDNDDGSTMDGQDENHLKMCKRSPAMFVCVLLIVVVAICAGITAAILSRNKDSDPSLATAGSDAGPLSPSPTNSPMPATIAPTESPTTKSPTTTPTYIPTDTPTDTPTNAPTNPSTYAPTDPPTNPSTPITPDLPNGPWQQLGQDVDGKFEGEHSGWSVSLSKDASIMAIGAPGNDNETSIPGYVRMYRYNSGTTTWQQLGQELVGESVFDEFGTSVALNDIGDIVAIGAPQFFSTGTRYGSVRVYQYSSSNSRWSQLGQELTGDGIGDDFGISVSLSKEGFVVAVGAPADDKNGINSGQAQVYKYDTASSEWGQLGKYLIGSAAFDQFGLSTTLNSEGDVVAIGANQNPNNGTGYVCIYQYSPTTSEWIQMGQELFGESNGDGFGESVSLSAVGDILAVASPGYNAIGIDAGRVHVCQYSPTTSSWNPLGQQLDGEAASDFFGGKVSLLSGGNVLAVGVSGNDNANGINSGHVRIYKYNTVTSLWTQVGDNINGEAAFDRSGYSVPLSGNGTSVAIGAPRNDGNGENVGHVRVYTLD